MTTNFFAASNGQIITRELYDDIRAAARAEDYRTASIRRFRAPVTLVAIPKHWTPPTGGDSGAAQGVV